MASTDKIIQKLISTAHAKQAKLKNIQPTKVLEHEYAQDLNSLSKADFLYKHGQGAALDFAVNSLQKTENASPVASFSDKNSNLLQDTGTAAAISLGDNLPSLVGGLGYLATAPSDGSKSDLSEWFKNYMEEQQGEAEASRANFSDGTQQDIANQQAEAAARNIEFDKIKDPSTLDYGIDFLAATGEYLSNPNAAVVTAAESADSLLTLPLGGGAAALVARKLLQKKITKDLKKVTTEKARADILKRAAKTEAKAAGGVGHALTGVTEGGHNAIGSLQDIESMSPEQLAKSPEYIKLLQDNPDMTLEQARTSLALSIAKNTGVKSGLAAVAVGKVSGASDLFSKSLLKGKGKFLKKGEVAKPKPTTLAGKTKAAVGTIVGGALTEGVEEVFQSGGGQAIANIEAKRADPTRKTSEGVTDAAAAGFVAGGVTGGSLPAAAIGVKGAAKATLGVAKGIAKGVGKGKDVAKNTKERIDANNDLKAESSSNKWATLNQKEIPKEVAKAIKTRNGSELANAYITLLERKDKEINPKAKDILQAEIDKITAVVAEAKPEREKKDTKKAEEIIAVPEDTDLTQEQVATGVATVMANPEATYSADLSKKISGSGQTLPANVTKKQKVMLEAVQNKKSTLSKVLRKSQADVAKDIYSGGEGFAGLTEYIEVITQSIKDGDMNTTIRAINNLKAFNQSHSRKAEKGKMHDGTDIGSDLHTVIKDEAEAINQVFEGLQDTAIAAFPEYKKVAAQDKLTDKIQKHTPFGGTPLVATSTTLEAPKRIAIVAEALTSLLDPNVDAANTDVSAFRQALSSVGGVTEKTIPEIKAANESFKKISAIAEDKRTGEQNKELKASEKTLLKAYDTLTASDVAGAGKLQGILETQDNGKDTSKDIPSLFVAGEVATEAKGKLADKVKELGELTGSVTKLKKEKATKENIAEAKEKEIQVREEVNNLKAEIERTERGETVLKKAETKLGHTDLPHVKQAKGAPFKQEHRDNYPALYERVKAVRATLEPEQEDIFKALPEALGDYADKPLEAYNQVIDLINKLKINPTDINSATDESRPNSTTPKNLTALNALEKLPLFSTMRKAFNYIRPKKLGLFHTEANLFTKLMDKGDFQEHLTANMSQETKEDALLLAKFVTKATAALQKAVVNKEGGQAINWINTPVEDFIDGNGNIDPLVAEAIAIALADWLHTDGVKSVVGNTNEAIAHLLGMTGEDARRYQPTANERNTLQFAGMGRNRVIQSMGKNIARNLGYKLKEDTNDAQRHIEETLITNLGTLAFATADRFGNKPLIESQYIHRFKVKSFFGTRTAVLLTNSSSNPSTKQLATIKLPEGTESLGAPTPVIRATLNETQVEDERPRLSSASEEAIQAMGNVSLTRDIIGLEVSHTPVYLDGEPMPKSEHYQPYGSPREHTATDNQNSIEHISNDNLYDFILSLTPEQQIHILDDLPEEGSEHKNNTKRNADIRKTILNEVEGARKTHTRMKKKGAKFIRFINHIARSNRRMTQGGSDGTPVGSKLIRELFVPKDQQAEIDPNKPVHLLAFKIAVLHALEDKTATLDDQGNPTDTNKGIDKSVDAAAEAAWENLLKNETVMAAVKAFGGDSSAENSALILAALPRKGIKQGEGGDSLMHRLHAIQALSEFQQAEGLPFKVTLGKEDDGIVNGTANLRMQALGANTIEEWLDEMAKVGVYYKEDGRPSSFAEFTREVSNLDPYEAQSRDTEQALTDPLSTPFNEHSILPTTGAASSLFRNPISWVNKNFKEWIKVPNGAGETKNKSRFYKNEHTGNITISQTLEEHQQMSHAVNFLINFTPEANIKEDIIKLSRAFSKDPLMQSNYQAAIKGLKKALISKIEGAVLIALEQANKIEDIEKQEKVFAEIERHVNNLSFMDQDTYDVEAQTYDSDTPWKFEINRDEPLNTDVGSAVRNYIAVAVEFTYGPALDHAFKKNYAELKGNMAHVINMTRLATAIYTRMYAALEKEMLKGTDQISLSVQQENEIKEKLKNHSPAVAHAFSENRLKDGIIVGNKENTLNRDEKGKHLNKKANQVKMEYKGRAGKIVTVESTTFSPKMEDPSVAAAAIFTHGIDAATQKEGMLRKESFTNVHDAKILSILASMGITEKTNKDFYEIHKNFSFLAAALEMITEMVISEDATPEIVEQAFNEIRMYNESLQDIDNFAMYAEFLDLFNKQIQHNRKEAFSLDLVIHQFFNSDGSAHNTGGTKTLEEVAATWQKTTTKTGDSATTEEEETPSKGRDLNLVIKNIPTEIAYIVKQKRNQILIANKHVKTNGYLSQVIDLVFPSPEEGYTSEDRIVTSLYRGIPTDENPIDKVEDIQAIQEAINAGASFVTSSATSVLTEMKQNLDTTKTVTVKKAVKGKKAVTRQETVKAKEGGDSALASHLAKQGYTPSIHMNSLIWAKTENASSNQLTLGETLLALTADERELYQSVYLKENYVYTENSHTNFDIRDFTQENLRNLLGKYSANDPRTSLIQAQLDVLASNDTEGGTPLSARALKTISAMSIGVLTEKFNIKEEEAVANGIPSTPLLRALSAELQKRIDAKVKLPLPNFKKGTDFENLTANQLAALQITQDTEDAAFLKDYYDSVVKEKGYQAPRKQTLAPETVTSILRARGTVGIFKALEKHFASASEKIVLKAIVNKLEGVSFKYFTASKIQAYIDTNTALTEADRTILDNATGSFAYLPDSKSIIIFAEAVPSIKAETFVDTYLAAADMAAITEGFKAEGITESAQYAGMVAAYKRFYPSKKAPTSGNIRDFLLDARHNKTVKAKLQSSAVAPQIYSAISKFLRKFFKLPTKELFTEYDVLIGYAAQTVYVGKFLTEDTLQLIAQIEKKSYRGEKSVALTAAKKVLLKKLKAGETYAAIKKYMESIKKHDVINKEMFRKLEQAKGLKAKLNFSSIVSDSQYDRDSDKRITDEMDFDKTNTMNVFDTLSKFRVDSNPEHVNHLKKVLNLISPAIDKLRLIVRTEDIAESYGSEQGGNINLRINTGAKANNIEMTAQELYVHETFHAFLRTINAKKTKYWKKIEQEYLRAAKHLKVEDFLAHITNPTAADIEAATKLRDHALFNNTSGGTDYQTYFRETATVENADSVEEFTVLANTNEAVITALRNLDVRLKGEQNPDTGILARLADAFQALMNFFTDKIYSLSGLKGDTRMIRLTELLMGTHNAQQSTLLKYAQKGEGKIDAIGEWVQKKLGETNIARGIQFASDQYKDTVIKNVREIVGKSIIGQSELFLGIGNEFTYGRLGMATLSKLLAKSSYFIERKGQQIVEYIAREITETLPNLTKETSTVLYNTLLETDAQSLLAQHTIEETFELLTSVGKRKDRVKELTAELYKIFPSTYARYMKLHAEDLGYHITTGERLRADGMYTNASQIANLWGLEGKLPSTPAAELIPILDEIATLTAIGYSSGKDSIADIFSEENYGIEALELMLLLQKETVDISATEAFEGDKFNMRKGYVRETLSTEIDVVTGTSADHRRLTALGYTRGEVIPQDPSAKSLSQQHYYTKQGGQQAYLTGILSLASTGAKGTDIFQPTDTTDELGKLKLKVEFKYLKQAKQAEMRKTVNNRTSNAILDPAKRNAVAQPLFDSEGKITGYRMILSNNSKDEMLHRKTDFTKAIGHTLSGITRKKASRVINRELMDNLYETFEKDYAEFPHEFETLSAINDSDRYFLIPEDAREYAKTLFGGDQIIVRREQMDIAFGYRKWSVAQLRHNPHPEAGAIREVLRHANNALNLAFNNQIGISLESYYQAFVATAKDIIVIKSGVVTGANIASNMVLLWWSGVDPVTAAKDHAVAYKATYEYLKDQADIFSLSRKMNAPNLSAFEFKKLSADRARLRQRLYNNPVRELMEAGLYQSIVDDVEVSENVSETRNKIDDLIAPLVNKTPKVVATVAKTLLMTHDSKIYKVFRDAAQISDFAARYSLHKHNMKQGMPFDNSISDVVTTFVNYDAPQPKWLQYANDSGLIGFSKWLFRMQQVFVKRFGQKMARSMIVMILHSMFSGLANPIEGVITGFDSILQRMGKDWFGALDKSAVFQMAM